MQQVIFVIMADNMELFKQFQDNPSLKKWLSDLVFNLTYREGKPYELPNLNRPKPFEEEQRGSTM